MTVISEPVNTAEAWSERARSCEEPWEACGWSYEGQVDRHEEVVEALAPMPGESLLDFGCGTGELAEILPASTAYLGYDTADGMVERARREHPDRLFTGHYPHGRFDLVACVGCFNLPDHWSKLRTWHTLRHLWDTTGCRALAVSLYAGEDGRCLIYREEEISAAARALAFDATVTRIRPNDLLLVVRR